MNIYISKLANIISSKRNILEIVSEYTQLEYVNGMYHGKCPFHNEGVSSMVVDPTTQTYYCLNCGAGGDKFNFIMNLNHCSYEESVEFLASKMDLVESNTHLDEEKVSYHRIYEIYKLTGIYYYCNLNNENVEKYIAKRQLSKETVIKFGLGYSPQTNAKNITLYNYLRSKGYSVQELIQSQLFSEKDGKFYNRFWNRLMFPIMDLDNRIIAFGGRVLGDEKPKYINSTNTVIYDKSQMLYALNYAQFTKKEYFLLGEGYMDIVTLHQAGYDNAIATLGTALTKQQALLIKSFNKDVILAYDNDDAGVKATLRALRILKETGVHAKVLRLDDCKDPDEYLKSHSCADFDRCINNALSEIEFKVSIISNNNTQELEEEVMNMLADYKKLEDYNRVLSMLQRKFQLPNTKIANIKTQIGLF